MLIIPGIIASSYPRASTAFESIATATGTGSSGTITFSSISSSYQHLQLRIFGDASANDWIYIRFNNDTGTNYARHVLSGNGSTVSAGGLASTNATRIMEMPATTTSGLAGGIIDIHDYASTTKNKTVRSFNGYDDNGSGYVYLMSVLWNNTAAINRIDLVMASGNFSTDTRVALYGIKGA